MTRDWKRNLLSKVGTGIYLKLKNGTGKLLYYQTGDQKDISRLNRARLAKRKIEIQEVRKEKQTLTSKKHDKKCQYLEER